MFSSKTFADYAKKNLVLVRADFPRKIQQSEELKKANQELKEKYVNPWQGYPTTVLLDSEGKKLGQKVGYPPGSGPEKFIASIQEMAKQ